LVDQLNMLQPSLEDLFWSHPYLGLVSGYPFSD
jgi:hypothetical protein